MTDRLYEANVEEFVSGIGDNGMAVSDAGKWTALAIFIGARVGWTVRGLLRPAAFFGEAGPVTPGMPAKEKKRMQAVVKRVQKV